MYVTWKAAQNTKRDGRIPSGFYWVERSQMANKRKKQPEIILLLFLPKITIKIKTIKYKIYILYMKIFYQLYSSNISLHLVKKLTLIFR